MKKLLQFMKEKIMYIAPHIVQYSCRMYCLLSLSNVTIFSYISTYYVYISQYIVSIYYSTCPIHIMVLFCILKTHSLFSRLYIISCHTISCYGDSKERT
jgi:hypothetical protein